MNKTYGMVCLALMVLFSAHAMDNGVDLDEVEEVVPVYKNQFISADKVEKPLYKFRDVGNERPWALVMLRNYCSGMLSQLPYENVLKKHGLIPLDHEIETIVRSAIVLKEKEVWVKMPIKYGIKPNDDEVIVKKSDSKTTSDDEAGWHMFANYVQRSVAKIGTVVGDALSGDVPDPIFDALRAQGVTSAGPDESEIA